MNKLIEKLFGTNKGQKHTDARLLRLESLEDRQMLDAAGFDVAEAGTLFGKPKPDPVDPTPVEVKDYDVDPRAEFSQALQNIFNGLKADGTEILEGEGGVENVAIVVTTDYDGMTHSNDFNADGYGNVTLRESFDYVGKYFDLDAFENAGKPWEQFTSYLTTTPVQNGLYFTHVEMHTNAVLTSQIVVSGFDAANPCLVDGKTHTISAATTRVFSVSAQGFTVENATISGGLFLTDSVDATASDAGQGNAIYVAASAQATFNDVTFTPATSNATKPQPVVVKNNGGAIYNLGDVTLVNGAFSGLTAENGGAVYNKGTLTVDGTAFSSNAAENGYGGAIYNAGTLTIDNAEFAYNVAFLGGAIYNSASGVANIGSEEGNVVFANNSAAFKSVQDETCGSGGAIYNSYSSTSHNAGQLTIQNVRFNDNFAPKYGGAIANYGNLAIDGSRFTANIAGVGGAICNAGTATVANSNFNTNKALNVKDSSDFYSAGGMGGAIYSANNGTAVRAASLTLTGKVNFTENYANRAGAGLDIVSGTVTFDYADGGKFQFLRNSTPYGLGGAICLAVESDAVSFNGGDRTPTDGFYFNNNKASFANTISSATKLMDSQSLVENFGFNYATVRASQYDSFVRFLGDNFMDHKFDVGYIASLYDYDGPAESITFWYGGDTPGARKEVTVHLRKGVGFVTLTELGINPQNKPGVYKVEFYFDNNPTCFELLIDTTRTNDIAIRRVDNQQLDGARSFSMISSSYPIDYIETNWGSGPVEVTPVGGFSAVATHFFDQEDPYATISVTVHYMDGTSHDFQFAYNLTPESKKDWRLDAPKDADGEATYHALLDVAFAEEEQFDLFDEVQL